MGESDLKLRTKEYTLGIIRLFSELPNRTEVQILGRQLFRSGPSVGAQSFSECAVGHLILVRNNANIHKPVMPRISVVFYQEEMPRLFPCSIGWTVYPLRRKINAAFVSSG
jgi:hypothetical protein